MIIIEVKYNGYLESYDTFDTKEEADSSWNEIKEDFEYDAQQNPRYKVSISDTEISLYDGIDTFSYHYIEK